MKKEIKKILFCFLFLLFYLIIGNHFHIFLFCPIKAVTGLYCPGCGITRMLLSLLKLDFYQAFRYNPLLFLFLPFMTFYYMDYLFSIYKKKTMYIKRMEPYIWYFCIALFLIYGVLRNVPGFEFLQPTVV